jgi:signal transduction histidine kinase
VIAKATAAGHASPPPVRADLVEARLVERAVALARFTLAMAAVFVLLVAPPTPSPELLVPEGLLQAYAVSAALLLAYLMRAKTIPARLPVFVQMVDVFFAATLAVLPTDVGSSFVLLLVYPILTAAYRWGFREVMITAIAIEAVLVGRMLGLSQSAGALNGFVLRATAVGAAGLTVGYLAENERQRRFEERAISLVLERIRLGGKLADTVNLVLTLVRNALRAKQVVLVLEDTSSRRVLVWPTGSANPAASIARPEYISAEHQADYLFELPGSAWHASTRWLGDHGTRFDVVALDDMGLRLKRRHVSVPKRFLDMHRCTRFVGASLKLSDEWAGRVLVLNPGLGVHREQTARFALNLAQRVAPAVYDHYLVRRLRTQAQALERGRIARELHDGITQSLLGLEMEIVVIRRRAPAEGPTLSADLARVHRIVRDEVVTVRELMEGIRVGDVEAEDFLHHIGNVVDRFSRHTGIAARFVSDGRNAALSPYVRRHMAGIIHEALVNVRKHSGADQVIVRTALDAPWWNLSIEDDGRGFEFAGRRTLEELDSQRAGPRTLGERVRLIGGTLAVESRPGFGARIEVAVPVPVKAAS